MTKMCIICGCSEDEVDKMFNFPTNPEKCASWQQCMGFAGIKDAGFFIRKKICSRHFTPDCYTDEISYTLTKSAVPTLHPAVALVKKEVEVD
ncbi:unnamed protein product [Brassicogethes aeneus]|uniref:THAP-type domain-containing protein n=1 Tax=Brassicogethes aeneus TaxID=1431903 RepID=A0A9P0BEB3_BRAAE|nr:unnamed protein product [Brassicogethes aeneus]